MLLGILSDTHDELSRTRAAIHLLRSAGAEAFFHCGDFTQPDVVLLFAGLPAYFTFGNHDSDMVPDLTAAVRTAGGVCLGWGGEAVLAGKRVAACHGHLSWDVRRLLAANPDYLFSGHSHEPADRMEGAVRRINPGALHRADRFTVALLDLADGGLRLLPLPQ